MKTSERRFEDRLLTELKDVVTERPRFSPGRAVRRRPRLAAAGAAAAVGAVLAVGLPALVGGTAYAVTPQEDGTIRVEIRDLSDADGLEEALAEHGVKAEVDYLPVDKVCAEPRFEPADVGPVSSGLTSDDGLIFEIDPGDMTDEHTLVITTHGDGVREAALSVGFAEGPVAPCEPVDAEPIPPLPGEDGDNGEAGSGEVVED